MPATFPAVIIHSLDPVYSFGLEAEPPHMFLHGVMDRATRQRVTEMDDNMGIAVYESFIKAEITYDVDCHIRAQSGVQNEHPGKVISGSALQQLVGSEEPFKFNRLAGEYVMGEATRGRRAGEFHKIDFRILHIFPEGDVFGSNYSPDIDNGTSPPIVITDPTEGDGSVDPETGVESLRTLRFFYEFTPARGHVSAVARTGYVTRLMSRSTTPDKAAFTAYNNPPDYEWQSTESNIISVQSGPAWDANDNTATPAGTHYPGTYKITGVYQLELDLWLYTTPDLVASPAKYDTPGHSDQVVVIRYNSGAKALKIGEFPNLAAVLTELGLANTSTLQAVYEAKSATYYHGTATGIDEIAFWRMSTAQPVSPRYFQMYELYGQRAPAGNFHFLRCTYTKFKPDLASEYHVPDPPPATHYYLATSIVNYPIESIDAVICHSDNEYDIGNASAVSALGITPPSAGKQLWIWKRGAGFGSLSHTWDWARGTFNTPEEFWAAMSNPGSFSEDTTRYDVLYHANGNSGQGKYYVGSALLGDPFASTVGLDLY